MFNYKLFISFTFLLLSFFSYSQSIQRSVIGSAGKHDSATNLNISWTIGEVIIETFDSNNAILTQGFHQPEYIISNIDNEFPEVDVLLFPNPASDKLILQFKDINSIPYQYRIIDLNGKTLIVNSISEKTTSIDINEYRKGVYILNLLDRDKNIVIKSFKIEKIK